MRGKNVMRMAAVLFTALGFLVIVGLPGSRAGGESAGIIDPSEIKPGMKGYGLTVFKDEQVERFEVEVIDVVKQALLRQDLILVRVSGHDLERTRVVAGMSGSPVYLEGRLGGAVAYGFAFGMDPITLLTPIRNMIEAQKKENPPVAGGGSWNLASSDLSSSHITPVATPLTAAGFSPWGLAELARELGPYGFGPLITGGGLSSTEINQAAAKAMKPGDAIGAAIITGDMSLVGIGTLTWREGNKVAAFGHPFFQAGNISIPLTSARIHTIVASQMNSVKMGSPTAVVGALTLDDQAAIIGELGKTAATIPFKIRVTNPRNKFQSEFNFNLCNDKFFTPIIIGITMMEAIQYAAPSSWPSSVRVKSKYWLKKYGMAEFEDFYPVAGGNFTASFLEALRFILRNPYEEVEFERLEAEITITDELKVATIESVATDSDEVEGGSTVEVRVTLRPFNGEREVYKFKVPVPYHPQLKQFRLIVTGGMKAPPDTAVPDNIPDIINFLKVVYPRDNLVLVTQIPGQAVDVRGSRLKDLPPSVVSILQPPNAAENNPAPEFLLLPQKTPYVIVGMQRMVVQVKPPEVRRK